jgi:ribosomal protein L37E
VGAQAVRETGRYPWVARCSSCGWASGRGYVAQHAAQLLADEHECEIPEGWCDAVHEEHDWAPGDPECRRCGADLSSWNDDNEKR